MSVRSWQIFTSVAAACSIILMMGSIGVAQSRDPAPDPAMGTWKLNVAKSKYSSGQAPKSAVVTIAPAGEGVKVVSDGVNPDGGKSHWEYTANYDGKDYPMTGNPFSDMISVKRINPTTVELTNKMAGKVTMNSTAVVSSDGKTLTVTQKGTTAQGQPILNVLVFEKA